MSEQVKDTVKAQAPAARRGPDGHIDTLSDENHMQVFARLAKGLPHGKPQPRVKRSH